MADEIRKLIDGNKQFRQKYFSTHRELFDELVEQGQRPKTMLIACCDSRIDPATIFNCKPGDLFVIRNVANLVPPCEDNHTLHHGTSAALEFGACFLNVEHIIVLGHTHCGGIQALLENTTVVLEKRAYSFISRWMTIAQPAYDKVMKLHSTASLQEKVTLCGQYALINSLENLASFPWIHERIERGMVSLHAWYFDLETGMVHRYNKEEKKWHV